VAACDERTVGVLREAAAQFGEAAAAKKCWSCGCLHSSLAAVHRAVPEEDQPPGLQEAMAAAEQRLEAVRYDCLGCEVCYPAVAVNAVASLGGAHAGLVQSCPTETIEARDGWPPLPGSYAALRYNAPVAVCTLTDQALARSIEGESWPEVAIVGSMQTENLGIERLIRNVLANPNIRFVVVCGTDTQQAVGHLPGRSLVALSADGVDDELRIVNAPGKRPILKNLEPAAIDHFRRTVEVVDLIGDSSVAAIHATVRECAARWPGAAVPYDASEIVRPTAGYIPQRMVPDPSGYFVLFVDARRRLLSLEHYRNDGVLDAIVEGAAAAEIYTPAIANGLVSRLDHAAYLGRELARAEHALANGLEFVQDAAPEQETLGQSPAKKCCSSC
jgi:tetrahydromethanopterin S-methyltransferase subunit A